FPHSVHPFVRGQSLEPDISAVGPVERAASTPSPVKWRDPSGSFELPSLRNRTSLLRRLLDERRDALAPNSTSDSDTDRAQHGGSDEGVPEPGQPELRIERAGNGQHQGQAKREAEALGGLDQPRGEALVPGLRSGAARDRERRQSRARPGRTESRPRQGARLTGPDG